MKTKKILTLIFTLFISLLLFTNCDFGGTVSSFLEPFFTREPDPITVYQDSNYPKQECDWLIIMYVDGDNDLHDALYYDLNEIEEALYLYKSKTGTKPTVKVVALWDGYNLTKTTIGGTATQILELGADSSRNLRQLCANTKDLTITASTSGNWINYNSSTKTAEVNMGSQDTLTNFLKWVDDHYEAKHRILQFSNHGGGPRSAINSSQRRALCWDYSSDSNQQAFLKTQDVSIGLANANFTKDNLDMLIFDVCLGASIEDSYQFRNCAKYMLASANNVPGAGLDYTKILDDIANNSSIEKVGKGIIDNFKVFYTDYLNKNDSDWAKRWKTEIDYWQKKIDSLSESEKKNLPSNYATTLAKFYFSKANTLSLIDLSKIEDVATSIDQLADYLLQAKSNSSSLTPYVGYNFLSHNPNLYKPIYLGTFSWLHDIGFFALNINTISLIDDETTEIDEVELYGPTLDTLKTKAEIVMVALSDAILYSWREGPSIKQNGGISPAIDDSGADNSLYYGENLPFGLTISGASVVSDGASYVDGYAPSFYKSDLDFGKETSWGDLLIYYFGKDKYNSGILH